MEERGGRILLNEEETQQMNHAVRHPDRDALRRRDAFLASFADTPVVYRDDGGISFEMPVWTTTEQVKIRTADFTDGFYKISNRKITKPTAEDVFDGNDFWDIAA